MKNLKLKQDRRINKDIKFEKLSIECNKFNLTDFKEALRISGRLEKAYYAGKDIYPAWEELHQDLWNALYKYDPQLVDPNKMDIRYLLNAEIMKTLMQADTYKETRQLTRLDFMGSIISAEVLSENLKELIEELREKYKEQLEALEQAQKDLEEATDQTDNENGEQQVEGTTEGVKNTKKYSLEEAQRRLEEEKKKIKDIVNKKVVNKINKYTNAATARTKEIKDFISAWGLEESNTFIQSGYQEKMQLLDKLRGNPKLKRIAELAGRYQRMVMGLQKQQIKYGTDSIHNVILGDDLGKILPSELMKLNNNLLKKLFKVNLLEKKILQYEYKGKEKVAKGAIIICLDSSGSMEGTPEVWAKAVAMGILEIAKTQKRDLYVIHFDASKKNNLHTNFFPKENPIEPENLINMAEYLAGGGTDFEEPLELARDKIMLQKQFSKADIIFITDGESTVRKDWLVKYKEWKKQNNVKIYSILINTYHGTTCSLDLFADHIMTLNDLNNGKSLDDSAYELFSLI